eukprot:c25961_g1_i1 orf=312-470(+)
MLKKWRFRFTSWLKASKKVRTVKMLLLLLSALIHAFSVSTSLQNMNSSICMH